MTSRSESSGVERTTRLRAGPSSVVERTMGLRAGPSSGVERTRRRAGPTSVVEKTTTSSRGVKVSFIPFSTKSSIFTFTVAGFAPYEKRTTEFLKVGKDKTALKIAKRKLGTHKRAQRKREEMSSVLCKMRSGEVILLRRRYN
ncbi:hypothetical protein F2Q70_00031025 [Brassica cretica]|uniref:60S ribosomal protein L36 n=1 Tax=Brassica cretica TaxID=69181 RepID=A0A8S9FB76_BRACR|nr:hypothetical protein F2Q70_00031025 [Brassica cretica]